MKVDEWMSREGVGMGEWLWVIRGVTLLGNGVVMVMVMGVVTERGTNGGRRGRGRKGRSVERRKWGMD